MRLRSRLLTAGLLGATFLANVAGPVVATEEPVTSAEEVTVAYLVEDGDRREVERVSVPASEADATIAELLDRPGVVTADIDAPVRAFGDPREPEQWHLATAGPPRSAPGQVLAILDTGVEARHPDLEGVVIEGIDLLGGTGCPGTCDPNGHGTHIAGVAAAIAGNGIGGRGVASGLTVLPVRVLDDAGVGSISTVVEGIEWAVAHGATVINLSLGGPQDSSLLRESVDAAIRRGVVVVAAAGNTGRATPNYPAAYRDVIGVTGVDRDTRRPGYASFGTWVDLAAPATAILSTLPPARYGTSSGTSMAAPQVAATAAIVLSQGEAPHRVRSRLLYRSTDVGTPGFDPQTGYGVLDVEATTTPVVRFVDLPAAGSHADAVTALAATAITVGCGDGTRFCPHAPVTRAEIATFVLRAARLGESSERRFRDTDASIHEAAINAIARAGITVGCGDKTTYCPEALVTRAEMATMLARALGLPLDAPDRFVDDEGLSHERSIDAVARAGITVGCGNGRSFCPHRPVTRAEMATFLTRAFDL